MCRTLCSRVCWLLVRLVLLVSPLVVFFRAFPHYVLKLPLAEPFWSYVELTGNEVPWTDGSVFAQDEVWHKPGDVVVVGMPFASGATWILHTVQQIKSRGTQEYEDLNAVAPWVDFVSYPAQPLSERLEHIAKSTHRVFKTHQGPPVVKLRDDVKYIVLFRNPVALMEGSYYFFESIAPEFRSMWGGFPPAVNTSTFAHFALKHIAASPASRGAVATFVAPFLRQWWPYRGKPNVEFVHLNAAVDVSSLARFLDVELSADELSNVKMRTSQTWMREHASVFDFSKWFERLHAEGKSPVSRAVVARASKPVAPYKLTLDQSTSVISRVNIDSGMCVGDWLRIGGPVNLNCELE